VCASAGWLWLADPRTVRTQLSQLRGALEDEQRQRRAEAGALQERAEQAAREALLVARSEAVRVQRAQHRAARVTTAAQPGGRGGGLSAVSACVRCGG
jgi:hypothetical protein